MGFFDTLAVLNKPPVEGITDGMIADALEHIMSTDNFMSHNFRLDEVEISLYWTSVFFQEAVTIETRIDGQVIEALSMFFIMWEDDKVNDKDLKYAAYVFKLFGIFEKINKYLKGSFHETISC